MPDQKTMWTRCQGGFSVMWVPKLLLSLVKIRIFCPKMTKFCLKLAFFGYFWPGLAGSLGALLVGWLVVVARAVPRKTPEITNLEFKSQSCLQNHVFLPTELGQIFVKCYIKTFVEHWNTSCSFWHASLFLPSPYILSLWQCHLNVNTATWILHHLTDLTINCSWGPVFAFSDTFFGTWVDYGSNMPKGILTI